MGQNVLTDHSLTHHVSIIQTYIKKTRYNYKDWTCNCKRGSLCDYCQWQIIFLTLQLMISSTRYVRSAIYFLVTVNLFLLKLSRFKFWFTWRVFLQQCCSHTIQIYTTTLIPCINIFEKVLGFLLCRPSLG